MTTLNLSAIATFSMLPVLAAISLIAPAHAGEVNLTCNTTSQGTSTTIALNSEDSIPFGNWSVSDAIDVAYAVKKNCQNRGVPSASSTTAPKYRVNVNSGSTSQKIDVRQQTTPAPVTANVNSSNAPASALW